MWYEQCEVIEQSGSQRVAKVMADNVELVFAEPSKSANKVLIQLSQGLLLMSSQILEMSNRYQKLIDHDGAAIKSDL